MSNRIKLGIVIVNYNGTDLTIDCLRSLEKSTFQGYRVYIVDNGSKAEQVNELSQYCRQKENVVLFDTKINNGIAKGNNIGVVAALKDDCEFIMLLNNDTVVEEKMLEILVGKADDGYKMCTPLMFYHDVPNKIWCAGGKFNRLKGTTTHFFEDYLYEDVKLEERDVEYVPTCCLLIDAGLFNEYGNFDEDYFLYYDDTDFIYRLQEQGHAIRFVPSAKLWHKVSSSSGGSQSKLAIYYFNRNRLYFINKNLKGFAKISALLFTYSTRIIQVANAKKRKVLFAAIKDYHASNMGWKDMGKIK